MNRSFGHLLLGVLSFVPLLSLGGMAIFIAKHPVVWEALVSAGDVSPRLYVGPGWGFQVGTVGLVVGLMLYVYFVVRVTHASEVTRTEKGIWVLALSIVPPVAIPAAWWATERFGDV